MPTPCAHVWFRPTFAGPKAGILAIWLRSGGDDARILDDIRVLLLRGISWGLSSLI